MKYKKLTPSQLNIMKTLWDKKEPMIASENINGVLEDLLSSNILLQYVESENDIKVIERLQEKLEERKKILERKS